MSTVAGLALLAMVIGKYVPLLGPAVCGMLLGVFTRNVFGIGSGMERVTNFCSGTLLRAAIVMLGASFTFQQAASVGKQYLLPIVLAIGVTMAVAYAAGRAFGVPDTLTNLIGVGTAICGATAVMTIGPVVQADGEETAYAIGTIFAFNLVAMVAFPLLGPLFGMSDAVFGAWAGIAIHDTSSVLAAAFSFGEEAGRVAAVVKLLRTLFLIPLVVGFAFGSLRRTNESATDRASLKGAFPTFILGFLALSLLSSLGVIGEELAGFLGRAARFLIPVVLVSVGLSADLNRLRRLGLRPMLVGGIASAAAAVMSGWLLLTGIGVGG